MKLALAIILFFSSCTIVQAQVVINEVMPAPSAGDEWIELYNVSDQPVLLTGWQVDDNSGLLTTYPSLNTITIPANDYFVFEIKNKLNNTGDQILLRKPDASHADFFIYTQSVTDQSWSRFSSDTSDFFLSSPTRGAANSIPISSPLPSTSASPSAFPTLRPTPVITPVPTLSSPAPSPILATWPLQLSEIVACPHPNEPEWIEFYNPNSTTISLVSWRAKDSSGNSRPINLSISPFAYGVVELSSAIFNNDGDILRVVDAEGNQLIEVELPACERGQSTVYAQGSWQQTLAITKQNVNTFLASSSLAQSESSPTLGLLTTPWYSSESAGSPTYDSYQLPQLSFDSAESTASSSTEQLQLPQLPNQPLSLPQVAEEQALVDPATENVASDVIPKTTILSLFLISLVAVGVGGYGGYQWYTERRAKVALETL